MGFKVALHICRATGLYDMVAKLEQKVAKPQELCFVVVSGSGCDVKMGLGKKWVDLSLQ